MRSGLEKRTAKFLKDNKVKFEYEPKDGKLEYTVPESKHKYTPDFVIDGVIYETKGYIRSIQERNKYVFVKQQNPDKEIVMVFQNPNLPIYKGSKTSYKEWFEKRGIKSISIKEFESKFKRVSNVNKSKAKNT